MCTKSVFSVCEICNIIHVLKNEVFCDHVIANVMRSRQKYLNNLFNYRTCANGYMPISMERRGKYRDSEHILECIGMRHIQSNYNGKIKKS